MEMAFVTQHNIQEQAYKKWQYIFMFPLEQAIYATGWFAPGQNPHAYVDNLSFWLLFSLRGGVGVVFKKTLFFAVKSLQLMKEPQTLCQAIPILKVYRSQTMQLKHWKYFLRTALTLSTC